MTEPDKTSVPSASERPSAPTPPAGQDREHGSAPQGGSMPATADEGERVRREAEPKQVKPDGR